MATKFWILLDGSPPSDTGGMSIGTSPDGQFVRVLGHAPAHIRGACKAAVAARFVRAETAPAGFYRCGNAMAAISGGRILALGDDPVSLDNILDDIEDGVANLVPLPSNDVAAWCPAEATRWLGGLASISEDANWGYYTLKVRR